ncbi:MAG: hypothetical protein ACW986_14820 [Promethearchaeota archaeon]|jgi:hypothetical protein
MNNLKKRHWLNTNGFIQITNLKDQYKEKFKDVVREIKENEKNFRSYIKNPLSNLNPETNNSS